MEKGQHRNKVRQTCQSCVSTQCPKQVKTSADRHHATARCHIYSGTSLISSTSSTCVSSSTACASIEAEATYTKHCNDLHTTRNNCIRNKISSICNGSVLRFLHAGVITCRFTRLAPARTGGGNTRTAHITRLAASPRSRSALHRTGEELFEPRPSRFHLQFQRSLALPFLKAAQSSRCYQPTPTE